MKTTALFFCIFFCSNFIFAQAPDRRVGIAVVNPVFRSEHRQTIDLSGTWDFTTDPDMVGDDKKWYAPDAVWTNQTTLKVPGCWEAQGIGGKGMSFSVTPEHSSRPIIGTYRGAGWYRKVIDIPSKWNGTKIWLKIGGVHAQGWFWVNGTYVGHDESYCGAFKYDITDLVEPGGKCVVVVKACNDVPSGKGLISWMERFGGLYRGVEVEATQILFIDDFWAVGDFDNKKVDFRLQLRSMAGEASDLKDLTVRVVVRTITEHKIVADSILRRASKFYRPEKICSPYAGFQQTRKKVWFAFTTSPLKPRK
jgi:beta-galactosidase/beta-glucuronidase